MKKNMVFILLCMTGFLTLAGCNAMYGKIRYNPGYIETVQAGSMLPDYQYYYIGRSSLPYAVIGIEKYYQFNDRLWVAIQTKKEVVEKINQLNYAPENDYRRIGADILDASGQKIGIWFSYYSHTVVKLAPDNVLDIFNPYNPNTYDGIDPYGH